MPYYIIDSQTGEQIEVDEAVYRAWAADNNITTTQGDPVVGGINKTSVSTGTNTVGSGVVDQPGTGSGSTAFVRAAGEPNEPLTAQQRRELQRESEQAQQIALANSIWASFRTVNGLRGYQQLDGSAGFTGGGYPEPEVNDPQAGEDITTRVPERDINRSPGEAVNAPGQSGIPTLVGVNIDLEDQFPTFATDGGGGGGPTGVDPYPIDINDVSPGGPGIDDDLTVNDAYDDIDRFRGEELVAFDSPQNVFVLESDTINPNIVEASNIVDKSGIVVNRDDWQADITAKFQEIRDGVGQSVQEIKDGVSSLIDQYALDQTDQVYLGPGVFPSRDGAPNVVETSVTFNERVQRIAEGISTDDPLYAGIIDPQDFGYDLRTQAFASDADRESYVQALQARASDNIGKGIELVDQRLALAQQLIASNPEIFARYTINAADDIYYGLDTNLDESFRVSTVRYLEAALADVLDDPQAKAAILLAIEQAGGDVSRADLRLDNITSLVASDPPVTSERFNVALNDRLTGSSTIISSADTDTVLTGNDTSISTVSGPQIVESASPAAVGGVYVSKYDPLSGRYDVINTATGQVVADDLTRNQARRQAAEANEGDAPAAAAAPPPPVSPPERRGAAAPVGGNFAKSYNAETGTYDVVNTSTGAVVATGLTEQQATLEAQNASVGDPSYGSGLFPARAISITQISSTPASPGGRFAESFNAETGSYDVINIDTGAVVATGLTEQQATLAAQNASIGDPSYGSFAAAATEEQIQALDNPPAVDTLALATVTTVGAGIDDERPAELTPQLDPYGIDGQNIGLTEEEIQALDNPVSPAVDPYEVDNNNRALTDEEIQAQDNPPGQTVAQQATLAKAQAQATLANQQKQADQGDWRVKLRLAPGANYLYRANDGKGSQAGILQPLAVTDGVVFPYTPVISTSYRANYTNYDLTHSNYRGYFYQGSAVEEITIQAMFTAQDTYEANYLLAVIHFFKAVTKMFYGQDAERGAPPPLVYLQGFGEYQFNLHPCVVSQFTYNLPNDVDYIRARSPNINGTNLLQARQRQTVSTNPFAAAWERLQNAGLPKGGINTPPPAPTLGTNSPTYVPTKIDMTITLLPMQSREQQSQQFSLKQYANGDLLKGGFW